MKKYVVAFCFCAVFFLPVNSFSQPGECIQGDCKNGKGTFVWPDGKKYEGEFHYSIAGNFATVGELHIRKHRLLLIGLSTKTAILLTEFAKQKRDEGMSIADAAIESVKLRFRAVMMTALSFILGVIPLLIASGAGAESRKILGTAVFGGMCAATILSLAVVPMLFYVVQRIAEGRKKDDEPLAESPAED